jgi:hypothetical protein
VRLNFGEGCATAGHELVHLKHGDLPRYRAWNDSDHERIFPLGDVSNGVKFGSRRPHRRGLLCPHKRTSSVRPVRSEKCQTRTHAPQQTTCTNRSDLLNHLVGAGE